MRLNKIEKMPKFSCKCGQVINSSSIPNDFEMLMISEQKIDEITSESLKSNLTQAFVDVGATQVSGKIGDTYFSNSEFIDGLSRSIVHGMAGCIAGQITSKDCGSRVMGAALGEAIGTYMASARRQYMLNDKNQVISFVSDDDK